LVQLFILNALSHIIAKELFSYIIFAVFVNLVSLRFFYLFSFNFSNKDIGFDIFSNDVKLFNNIVLEMISKKIIVTFVGKSLLNRK